MKKQVLNTENWNGNDMSTDSELEGSIIFRKTA